MTIQPRWGHCLTQCVIWPWKPYFLHVAHPALSLVLFWLCTCSPLAGRSHCVSDSCMRAESLHGFVSTTLCPDGWASPSTLNTPQWFYETNICFSAKIWFHQHGYINTSSSPEPSAWMFVSLPRPEWTVLVWAHLYFAFGGSFACSDWMPQHLAWKWWGTYPSSKETEKMGKQHLLMWQDKTFGLYILYFLTVAMLHLHTVTTLKKKKKKYKEKEPTQVQQCHGRAC